MCPGPTVSCSQLAADGKTCHARWAVAALHAEMGLVKPKKAHSSSRAERMTSAMKNSMREEGGITVNPWVDVDERLGGRGLERKRLLLLSVP